MMQSKKRQRGMSVISWVFVLIFVGFNAYVALKVMPIYANNFTVKSALKSLEKDGIPDTSAASIYNKIQKIMQVNAIDFITRNNIHIAESGGVVIVEINYVEQRKIAGNIEILVTFNEQITIKSN